MRGTEGGAPGTLPDPEDSHPSPSWPRSPPSAGKPCGLLVACAKGVLKSQGVWWAFQQGERIRAGLAFSLLPFHSLPHLPLP